MSVIIENPVIRGFYPDPSVCEANGKYYLACSSFQYFPGVPLFESSDFINWKPIGHAITRKTQIDLCRVPSSGGVFAPVLRYHKGRFYMAANHNTLGRNFYLYTDDIYDEWSEPVFVDQEGIDPSLLFDEGRVYFTSNGKDENGNPCILQCEIDIETGEKLTKSVVIWHGSGGRYVEAPHLYHIGGWYYLMAAEGGTEYGHMVTYARAKSPCGPFEGWQKNPVLTNRNLGGDQSLIQGIGHGDMIKGPDGRYYIVCLGFRQIDQWLPFHHLGREVFLTRVDWLEDGWFCAGEDGTVHAREKLPLNGEQKTDFQYDFMPEDCVKDNPRWLYLRDKREENYRFHKDGVDLRGTPVRLCDVDSPTFIAVRQSEFFTRLSVEVKGECREAGVTVYMDEEHHYDLFCTWNGREKRAALRLHIGDAQQIVNEISLEQEEKTGLKIVSDNEAYRFLVVTGGKTHYLGKAAAKHLSSEAAGGFTGVVAGLYAVDFSALCADGNWAGFSQLRWIQRQVDVQEKTEGQKKAWDEMEQEDRKNQGEES